MIVLVPNFEKRGGLVVVVVQDARTGKVLMVAYTDAAGFWKTLETGLASFYSTSRNKSWTKGEESGNYLKVLDILIDCDGDAIVYLVEPQGEGLACHTGAQSCFYRSVVECRVREDAPKAGQSERLAQTETTVSPQLLNQKVSK